MTIAFTTEMTTVVRDFGKSPMRALGQLADALGMVATSRDPSTDDPQHSEACAAAGFGIVDRSLTRC